MARVFGLETGDGSALAYAGRLAAVRELTLGVGPLISDGEARRTWLRLALLCDLSDTLAAATGARGSGLPAGAAARAGAATITSGLLTLAALRSGIQRLVSYLVRTTPSANVRVSTRVRFTKLSRAVKNGVPPPTKTGAVASTYSSISPVRMAAAASVAPPMSMGPPSSALSRAISVTASPVTRRVFQSTVLVVEENTTFGISCQRRANSISAGVAPGCWSAVGQEELIGSHHLRP